MVAINLHIKLQIVIILDLNQTKNNYFKNKRRIKKIKWENK